MKDFSLQTFKLLCIRLKKQKYKFITFLDCCSNNAPKKFVVMRHDIDRDSKSVLKMAKIENDMDIKASYYFRTAKKIYNERLIKELATLGHEIGYHYEDLSLAKGDFVHAIIMFKKNLKKLRQIFPVKTICMHGSPLSKWDNRLIWQKYNYHDFDIIGEPYFDVDFNKVLYLTDTGRRWNGEKVIVRDKFNSKFNYNFKSTFDIIKEVNNNKLPDKLMINIHPQRWVDKLLPWLIELVWQNIKNIAKHLVLKTNL